ncbi:MAG TPA: TatD family hydrolase, partial [Dehalococcoidia bacterium]|nr:TatD family hydrolase [Dehalococcoidia bacterium]
MLFPAVGYHPHEAKDVSRAQLLELESLVALPEVVCVGEIGLDFFRGHSPEAAQRRLLDAQLEIAVRTGKPVSVHSRGAEGAIYDHLAGYSTARHWRPGERAIGIMHCFGGTTEQASAYIALGFHISFACPVTYPANHEARKMALELPLESIVVETDGPYLPPQPFRGQRNEPAHVRYAVEAIAAARAVSVTTVAEATTRNAAQLFGVRLPARAAAW